MAEFILKKLRGYAKTWPTTIPGVLLLVNAVSSILVCVLDPACGMDVISKEWDKIMQAVVGLGLMEARSTFTSSQDLKLWLVGGLVSTGLLWSTAVPVQAGDEPLSVMALPELPELPAAVENPSWLERGSLWTFAWMDAGNGDNGAGLRLGYEITDEIRIRFDYLVESFDFGSIDQQSEATLSMRYEIRPGDKIHPYLIAGGGSASLAAFEWQYLIGAGVDYEFGNGITLFAEFLHIRTEDDDFADRNEIRAGVGIDLSSLGKLPLPFFNK